MAQPPLASMAGIWCFMHRKAVQSAGGVSSVCPEDGPEGVDQAAENGDDDGDDGPAGCPLVSPDQVRVLGKSHPGATARVASPARVAQTAEQRTRNA